MYATEDIANITDISVRAKDKTITEILDECLEGTNLTYEISGSAIVIKKRKTDKITISGWIRDTSGEALPGATVSVRGSKQGAIAGLDGHYTFSIPAQEGLILTYSFIGMEKKTVKYTGKRTINVTLNNSSYTEIDEVVVTGYQNIQRRDLVGSITTVKAKDIIMPSYTTIDQMLQGRVAGMVVTNTSSRVGTAPKIQIRGTSTLLGNQDPLWVVDGIIQEDPLELDATSLMTNDLKNIIGNQISWLNPADIESISILKDASATAIYGSKASNGVIEITTKKNTTDRLSVNYTSNFIIGTRPNYDQFNYMNSKERVLFSQEAFNWGTPYSAEPIKQMYTYEGLLNMYLSHDISSEEFLAQRNVLETQNTDWFKLLTRRAFSHNHNLSVSGGTNKYSYSASMGYSKSEGQDTNHRIDPTYSFGFSWRASEERFMRKYVGWITNLNFRGTYGIQGNALTRLSPDLILNQGTVADLYNRYQSTISQIPNPTLSWERTKSWNFGIDLELFNLFNMNLEYYTRRSNAIVELDLPYEYGISSMKRNGGIIHNRGIEYTLTFTPIQKRDYALSVSLNASKNWNEGGHTDIEVKASDFLNGRSDIILKQGYPLSSFWSYSFAGLNGQTGEPQFNLLDIPDDQRSRLIDPTTYLVYSGQRDPYFTGGLSLSFRYKSLTLNSSFSLLLGNKKRLPSPYSQFSSSYYMPDPYTNINRDLLNRWKEPGDEAHTIIPSLPKGNMSLIQLPNGESTFKIPVWEQSDAMVVSGSFLRCRNIGLSWQMKREWCEKIYMKNLSLNFNMDNIFVIASKRFNGFDPEISNSVLPRNYSLGINIGF